jgi:hypothetical protein
MILHQSRSPANYSPVPDSFICQSLQMLPRPIWFIFQQFRKFVYLHSVNTLNPQCLTSQACLMHLCFLFLLTINFLSIRGASKGLYVVLLIHLKSAALINVLSVALNVRMILPYVSIKTLRNVRVNPLIVSGFRILKFRYKIEAQDDNFQLLIT